MDGVVVVDKPKGMTSHDVVRRVKYLYQAKKAGHTGTLDPLATGILPVCLNRATKEVSRLMEGKKSYEVDILFGVRSTTFDLEGEIVERKSLPDDFERRLNDAVPSFTGSIEQKPPYYSAKKYQGRPLYRWAREGRMIDLPPHQVDIFVFSIVSIVGARVSARITCSKGTYIRSICDDIGKIIGCGAVMEELRRTLTGGFTIENAVGLQQLEGFSPDERDRFLLPLTKVFMRDEGAESAVRC